MRPNPHLYLALTSVLFGANYVIAKGLMPEYFAPMQIILVRTSLGAVFFSILAMASGKGWPERGDLFLLAICGLLGITANQSLFFVGLNLSRPVEAAIIHTTSPVWVLLIALAGRREKQSGMRLAGILLGLAGAMYLVSGGFRTGLSREYISGNLILLANIISYSIYLVAVRPLTRKYHPFVVMQWVFIFGWLGALPFTATSFHGWDPSVMDAYGWFAIGYVVIATTFLSFLLVIAALRHLPSSTTAYYIYLQPLIAAVFAFLLRAERLDYIHLVAAVPIFAGVFLVSRKW